MLEKKLHFLEILNIKKRSIEFEAISIIPSNFNITAVKKEKEELLF